MNTFPSTSSLECELRIIRAKNLESISTGNLFVRYYLCTGDSKKIRLESREIASKSHLYWNESTSFECVANEDAMNELKQQKIVFELRWRKTRFGSSKLLLTAEIGWKDVLESAELSIEKWVPSTTTSKYILEGVKPPTLQIGMKIQMPIETKCTNHARRPTSKWNECGCRDGVCNGRDEDIFALAATLQIKVFTCRQHSHNGIHRNKQITTSDVQVDKFFKDKYLIFKQNQIARELYFLKNKISLGKNLPFFTQCLSLTTTKPVRKT